MAPVVEDHTGTIGFNVICKVNTFSLTGSVNISGGRTGRCVRDCLTRCDNISDCVGGIIRGTGTSNCIRAVFNEEEGLPRLASDGRVVHTFNREITEGVPVRNATTSVVGVTVVGISRHVGTRGLHTELILRIRSRLVIRTPRSRDVEITLVIRRRVRGTIGVDIPLATSTTVKEA